MIAIRLNGGLGNQMFEYAAGRRLAIKHATNLVLDLSVLNQDTPGITKRFFELEAFTIQAAVSTKKVWSDTELKRQIKAGRIQYGLKYLQNLNPPALLSEEHYHFNPQVLEAGDNTCLEGFWQSEQYFADVANTIRADFSLASAPNAQNAALLRQIKNTNAVSLHVRRGDYVTNKGANEFHGTNPLNYYRAAIEKLVKTVHRPHFYVFSDDPEWCKDNLDTKYAMTFVDHNPPDKGYEDMRLMSSCQHHIIANSSFSWWGAWLNPSPAKTVIAPRRWFNDATINTDDVIPSSWVRI